MWQSSTFRAIYDRLLCSGWWHRRALSNPLGHAPLTDRSPPACHGCFFFGSSSPPRSPLGHFVVGGWRGRAGGVRRMWLAQIDRWSEPTRPALPGRLRMILRVWRESSPRTSRANEGRSLVFEGNIKAEHWILYSRRQVKMAPTCSMYISLDWRPV